MKAKEKVEIAVIGEVNVGKSSIIKYLTNDERIHVYPIPGETVAIGKYNYKDCLLIDTPGLNDTEKMNVKKTMNELKRVNYILFVLNASGTVLSKSEKNIFEKLKKRKKHILIVVNKKDKADSIESINRFVRKETKDSSPIVIASTKTGEGMAQLEEAIVLLSNIKKE